MLFLIYLFCFYFTVYSDKLQYIYLSRLLKLKKKKFIIIIIICHYSVVFFESFQKLIQGNNFYFNFLIFTIERY